MKPKSDTTKQPLEDSKVGKDLKEYIDSNISDMAESHIECWKDRYWRKSKKDIQFDLSINHDNSLEIERTEEDLKRKLNDKEVDYLVSKFHKAVIKNIY